LRLPVYFAYRLKFYINAKARYHSLYDNYGISDFRTGRH
jgi:hypothetical protein